MAPHKAVVKNKIQESFGPFCVAIKELREALELTQEGAARQMGIALNTWRQWEYGDAQPRQTQLEKIAGLTKDPAIRANFWLDIYLAGIKLWSPSQKPMNAREALFLRYVNDIVMAAKELCIAAADGSTASEEMLKHAADELIRRAGDARRTREGRAGEKGT